MVWYLTPDQTLIHSDSESKTNRRTNGRNGDNVYNRSDKIVTDPESGEIICSNCGVVVSDKAEDVSHLERHVFTGGQIDETRSRTGAPRSLASHDMGLATIVGKSDRDAAGTK